MTTSPPPPSAGRRMAVTLLAALPWPAVLFQFVTVLGGYDKLFRQFNVPVNSGVALLLNVSAWTRKHLEAAVGIAFALMVVSMVAAHTTFLANMSRRRRAAILTFVFGVPCLVFALAWLGVVGTHRTLVEGLQK